MYNVKRALNKFNARFSVPLPYGKTVRRYWPV